MDPKHGRHGIRVSQVCFFTTLLGQSKLVFSNRIKLFRWVPLKQLLLPSNQKGREPFLGEPNAQLIKIWSEVALPCVSSTYITLSTIPPRKII